MNYNHLYYFWNIAKEGSIKSASRKLNLSQSTLSDQLKTLEESIGEKLFERTGRKLILNQRGKTAFSYANRMFKISDELEETLLSKQSNHYDVVTIGFVPTIAKGSIYEILLPFINHPEFNIKVVEGEFDYIFRAFEMNDLDMIICEKPLYNSKDNYHIFKLVESTFFAVCSPKYVDAAKKFPDSLSKMPFLNYTNRSNIQNQIFEYFYDHSINPHIIGEIDDVNIIRRFTQNGHCFSILPQSMVAELISDGKLIVLSKVEDIKLNIYAMINNSPKNHAIEEVLKKSINQKHNPDF